MLRIHNTAINKQKNLVSRINMGKVVPLISNVVSNDLVLGGNELLVKEYGEFIDYPLPSQADFAQMIQIMNIMDDDVNDPWYLGLHYIGFLKSHLLKMAEAEKFPEEILDEVKAQDDNNFAEFLRNLDYPKLDNGFNNPLLILANFPLPIYLTTSYHNFLEMALRKAGKEPQVEICRWHDGLESIPSVFDDRNYEPTSAQPLVYHLLGLDEWPHSLVLTEDHYLEFLVAITEYKGKDED